MSRARHGLLVLALALLAAAAPAEAGGLDEDIAALGAQAAKELEALATWCAKERVYGSRDDALAALLEFEPEHREARKRLKYTKGDDGAWVQDPRYKRAQNWSKQAGDEAAGKLAAILQRQREASLQRCESAETIGDLLSARRRIDSMIRLEPANEKLPALLRVLTMRYYGTVREKGLVAEMVQAADELRSHHPEDVAVRALLGEVHGAGAWILQESARTLDEKGGLAKAAKDALDAAEVEAGGLSPIEKRIGLPWATGSKTRDVRAMGTQAPEVLASIARHAQAAGTLFAKALGREPSRRAGLTAYVLKEKGEADTFLAGYPVVDNPTLHLRKQVKLDLVYADGQSLVLEANPANAQLDLVTNEVLNQMFADTFLASEAPKGWHAEGISRYLAWKLTGTRLSIAVSGKYAGQGGDREVPGSEDSWLLPARAHVAKGVGLELLLGKGTDVFSPRDALVAYAFAVYLLEGHEGVVADFVTTYAKTADADRTCRDVLAMPRDVVEHRFARWLDEVTTEQQARKAAEAAKKAAEPPKEDPK